MVLNADVSDGLKNEAVCATRLLFKMCSNIYTMSSVLKYMPMCLNAQNE